MDENVPPGSSKGKGNERTAALPIRQQPVQGPPVQRPPVQRPPSTAQDGLWPSLGRDIGWQVLQRVCKKRKRVPINNLPQLGIQHCTLSPDGIPADGSQAFFSLLPEETMRQYDREYGLRNMDRVPEVDRETKSDWDCAFWLSIYLECCLSPEHLQLGELSPIKKSTWESRYADDYEMMGYENKKNIHNHWNAFFVLDQKEFRTPHLLSVIGDNNPLTADALNPSEIFSVVKFCTVSHCKEEYRAHKIIPVAVITMSANQLRLVQGYADPETCTFRLQIGEIHTDPLNYTRWNLHSWILRWLLSTPIGETT